MPNQYGGKCAKCGQWVEPGAGVARPGDDDGPAWVVEHRDCDAAASGPELPLWGVPAFGVTHGRNTARGYTLVRGPVTPGPGVVPLNEAAAEVAARSEAGENPAPPEPEAGPTLAERWHAFAEFEGYRRRERPMDALDAALEGADIAAMRAAVEAGRKEILKRFDGGSK